MSDDNNNKKTEEWEHEKHKDPYNSFMSMKVSYLKRIEYAAKHFIKKQNSHINATAQFALLFAIVTPITAFVTGLFSFNMWLFALICATCITMFAITGGLIIFEKIISKLLFATIVISTKRQMIVDVILQIDKTELSSETITSCSNEIDKQVQEVIDRVEKQHG